MRNSHFDLNPRYTAGSPGMIHDELYAQRIAADEKRAYERALTGVYGEADKLLAERLGLRGIVQEKRERGSGKKQGWEVRDLCTGETLFQLCSEALAKLGWRRYMELEAYEWALVDQAPPLDLPKYREGWYKLTPDMSGGFPRGWKIEVYHQEIVHSEAA